MNKVIMRGAGFEDYVRSVKLAICPYCRNVFDVFEFRDTLSLKEYIISGLCQDCQDIIFGEYD